ncbi:hypothetical protein [Streptomyces mobaraensis]|uniref:hypothetical protein n=1 Tax=Streptomyces mobaraensis TaxID=35621 RepID=UPI0012ACA434|nr:hypothetical protein [Streptomyces mobaraensis]
MAAVAWLARHYDGLFAEGQGIAMPTAIKTSYDQDVADVLGWIQDSSDPLIPPS